jgi:hypothetical protein
MPEPAPESERFLSAVEQRLPFADDERAEIVDELRVHLADCSEALRNAGMDPIEADRMAVDRLGSAEGLADELTRERRDPTRLLAAAGSGVWGVARGGVWGGLVGFGVVMVAAVALTVANNAAFRFLGADGYSWDPVTNAILGMAVLDIAALVAGRVVTPTVAARAGFTGRVVRRVTIPLGAAILLAYALLIWSGPLNWPAVVVLMSLPLWWIAGAWQTRPLRLGFPRRLAVGLVLTLVASVLASLVIGPGEFQVAGLSSVGSFDPGYGRMAAPPPGDLTKGLGSGVSTAGDYVELSLDVADRGQLAGWSDLRVEAWRGIAPITGAGAAQGPELDPSETAPFLTGPVVWSAAGTSPDGNSTWSYSSPWPPNAATLSGALLMNHSPGVSWAWVAITGIAPDGARYLLSEVSGNQVYFSGTALDWFEAVLAGR